MKTIEKVSHGNIDYAIVIRGRQVNSGHNFPSAAPDSLQVGVNCYRAGQTIRAHFHRTEPKVIADCMEVLHIDEGSCEVFLYDDSGTKIYQGTLETGDTITLLRGAHALRFLAPTRILEVKQGPYLGDGYKVFLNRSDP